VAARCIIEDGFPPDSISSDLDVINVHGPAFDLLTTLSKFLLLGMSLRDVIACATRNAGRIYNYGIEIGTLKPGSEADVAILELRDGQYSFTDSDNKTRTGRQRLVPVATVRGGKVVYPEYPVS
jgi:dihydroorotase